MIEFVKSTEWSRRPSEKEIFGNFIELGFGRQIEGMWSEMLYNRAFRQVPPYKKSTFEWMGLDRDHYNDRAPFWHSGYEEYDWETVGQCTTSYTSGTYTFKGTTSLLVTGTGDEQSGTFGLVQKGIHLQKGRSYQFQIFAGYQGKLLAAGLNGFGTAIRSEEKRELLIRIGGGSRSIWIDSCPACYGFEFTAEETEVVSIEILYTDPKGVLILSWASMMPSDNICGWRSDVVSALKEVKPPVIRLPGGCFTSFYNWESSIGDRDQREPQESFYWGGIEENDTGLDEFCQLAELVGFEPQICFNMMTSNPFKARQMVEYLNADQSTGMGRYRMLNGHAAPYGVKYFEMDNEPDRKWTAEQYAQQCVAFSREMRLADPSIECMMAAYTYQVEMLPVMLEIAGHDMQYVIYRQGDPEFVSQILPVLRDYNESHGTDVKLCDTEWLASCKAPDFYEAPEMEADFRWRANISNDIHNILGAYQTTWNYALNGAHRLLDYISYGGDFFLANFNNMCNTWGQNVIESTKDRCYLSCMGKVFAFFGRNFVPCTSGITQVRGEEKDLVFGLQTVAADGSKEQIYVINHSREKVLALLPEGCWAFEDGISAAERVSRNREVTESVRQVEIRVSEGRFADLEPLSVTVFQRVGSLDT